MRFLYPEFLYLMLIPAALLIYLISTNKDILERVFDAKTLDRLRIDGDSLGRSGHNLLAFAAFLFMTLALAQPVIERGEIRIKSRGGDLVIALDLSRSMQTRDFYPDRLVFAKQKLEEILPRLPAGRIGMIGFTSASFVVAPLTEDRESLLFLLRRLKPETVSAEGTDVAAALKGAEKLLRKSRSKKVLLVSDGGDETDIEALRKEVERSGIELNLWMVATRRGGPVPADETRMVQGADERVVISRANTALRSVAEASGGIYVEATLSQSDEEEILSHLKRGSGSGEEYEKVVHRRIELFYYPLLLALLLLPFALYSVGIRHESRTALVALLPLLVAGERLDAGLLDFTLIEKAEKAYMSGRYDISTKALERLSAVSPGNEVWFDLASSYYKSGRYKKALETYRKIVTSDRRLEMAKLYDMANCYVRLGDLQKGVELYRKVLKMGPDPDAKANLELLSKLLKKREKRRRNGVGGEGENRKSKKGGSAEKGSEAKRARPGGQKGGVVSRKLSEAEERKWLRLIEREPLKSKLYPLTPPEEGKNVKPW